MRHTFASQLADADVSPRLAMQLMRHSDLRLTTNVYTDPRVLDLAPAVAKLPALPAGPTSTDAEPMEVRRTTSVTSPPTRFGCCSASNGVVGSSKTYETTVEFGQTWHDLTAAGEDGREQRVKGFEPSTFSLEG